MATMLDVGMRGRYNHGAAARLPRGVVKYPTAPRFTGPRRWGGGFGGPRPGLVGGGGRPGGGGFRGLPDLPAPHQAARNRPQAGDRGRDQGGGCPLPKPPV